MGRGRRAVALDDPSRWVFNRMAHVYDARPEYPPALVDAIALAAGGAGAGVVDVGAGIGHLALPLARRGLDVVAVEPAVAMLERLRARADAEGLAVRSHHACAESMPLPDASRALALVADALHFLDAERAGDELGRVLAPGGTLAIVVTTPADTPYMRRLVAAMEEAAPRRPRDVTGSLRQLVARAGGTSAGTYRFEEETAVEPDALERILRTISFVGPAMDAARFAAFSGRVRALPGPRVYARTHALRLFRVGR